MSCLKKHISYSYESINEKNPSKNPINIHFDSINNFCYIGRSDEDNLYGDDKDCLYSNDEHYSSYYFPYDHHTEIKIANDQYTIYFLFWIDDDKQNQIPEKIYDDLENDIYLHSRDKHGISIYKLFKSVHRKEIYVLPVAGYSFDGKLFDDLINISTLKRKHKYAEDDKNK